MKKRRRRPRRKNKRPHRIVLIIVVFILFILIFFNAIPCGNECDLPDYIESAKAGYFQWPTPELYQVTSKFSPKRKHPVFGIVRAHNGVDISGLNAMDSPVVAIEDGVVISVNLNGGERGINVRIQHNIDDDVWVSRYQHLSVESVAVGQKVTKGEIIGAVGNSGVGTGPHLHLEVTYNGVLIDPLQLIQ